MRVQPLLYLLVFLASCTTARFDREEVAQIVDDRLRLTCQEEIWDLLETPLTAETAMYIAVMNHPWYFAKLAEIGISESEFLQASLLPNPLIEGYVRFSRHTKTNVEFSLLENLMGVILTPIRKQVAQAELERIKWDAAHEWIDRALLVQEHFFELQALVTELTYLRQIQELAKLAAELANLQVEQGNIPSLDLYPRKVEMHEAALAVMQAEKKKIEALERIAQELGLCSALGLSLAEMPNLPCEEFSGECLEDYAVENRLDLEALAWAYEANQSKWPLASPWAKTQLALGVSYEHEPEGTRVFGPAAAFAIPVFDYGQAERRRQCFEGEKWLWLYQAKEIAIRSEVRQAVEKLQVAREMAALYKEHLIPEQKKLVAESEVYTNAMVLGIFDLMDRKKKELQLQVEGVRALCDYWIARIRLDRSLGGKKETLIHTNS
jgi:cobalt-zinc-cadmium efflux system outer membrane protein